MVPKNVDFIKSSPISFNSFECLEVVIASNNVNYTFNVLYRPPNYCSLQFFEEFEQLLVMSDIKCENVVYLGDFNIWINDSISETAKKYERNLMHS